MRPSRGQSLSSTGVFHKIWRGHNREFVLGTHAAKMRYLMLLCHTKEKAAGSDVQWYSFTIMGNHVHETGRVLNHRADEGGAIRRLGNWMRNAHGRFGQWYNRKHDRQGKVAYDRPKTKEIKDDAHLLTAMVYADANPVRAGIVKHPAHYQYSSYRFYAHGEKDEVTAFLNPPQAYLDLGRTAALRQHAYRRMVDEYLRQQDLIDDQVQSSTQLASECPPPPADGANRGTLDRDIPPSTVPD